MKKIFGYLLVLSGMAMLHACHKIDVPVTAALTPDVFPQNSSQFIQAAGPAYAALRGDFAYRYWFMESLSTDEAILPARAGNWYDNQNYSMLHYHNWTKDHGYTNTTWTYLSIVIGATNQALSILDQTMPEGAGKRTGLAELRMVRALTYFMMMDLYGNVPLYTIYGDFSPKANSTRKEVFDYIEKETLACLPDLSTVADITTYGRANRYTAFALLAKMYLNSEYYTEVKRYDECVQMCDSVIRSGRYAIEPRASYLKMFFPNNGPSMKEFIFAIPYDPAATPFTGTNGYLYHGRYDIPRSEGSKFSLKYTPEGPQSTLPEYYAYFNDPGDIRNGQWLTGLQYKYDGTPLTVKTTKKGYDQFYTGADGADAYTYQINLTPNIELRQSAAAFDAGNDEIAWNMGYRNIKFYPDSISTSRNSSNDVPMFRYSDVVLMKAEAILRGAAATGGQTALSLVNDLRANRTTAPALGNVTLDDLYAERCREMSWESWHRNDMIRFGKFEGSWGFKTDNDIRHRIFPIPTSAMAVNAKLVQNPGYE